MEQRVENMNSVSGLLLTITLTLGTYISGFLPFLNTTGGFLLSTLQFTLKILPVTCTIIAALATASPTFKTKVDDQVKRVFRFFNKPKP